MQLWGRSFSEPKVLVLTRWKPCSFSAMWCHDSRLLYLCLSAYQHANLITVWQHGGRCRAEKLLTDGGVSLAMQLGKQSRQYIQVQLILVTMLSVTGRYQQCIDTCNDLLPAIAGMTQATDAMAYTCLRLGAAYIAVGELDNALDMLTETVRSVFRGVNSPRRSNYRRTYDYWIALGEKRVSTGALGL